MMGQQGPKQAEVCALKQHCNSNEVFAFVGHTVTIRNKTWTNPQIANHQQSHELRHIRPQAQHKNPDHTYSKFFTPMTPHMKKI
jgi:hypothetical protein